MANYGYGWGQYGMPMYPQQQIQQQQIQQPQVQQMVDERIWVANEQAADSYLVAPNSLVRLWDSNKNIFYEKRADATGRLYPMEAYEYRKIEANRPKEAPAFDYRKELDSLNERLLVLEGVKKHEQSTTNNKRAKEFHGEL